MSDALDRARNNAETCLSYALDAMGRALTFGNQPAADEFYRQAQEAAKRVRELKDAR